MKTVPAMVKEDSDNNVIFVAIESETFTTDELVKYISECSFLVNIYSIHKYS